MSQKILTLLAAFSMLAVSASPVAAIADVTAPSVTVLSPTSANVGSAVNFTTTYAESGVGISHCYLEINGVPLVTNMFLSGTPSSGAASQLYTFNNQGTYQVRAVCADLATNFGFGPLVSVAVSTSGSGSDNTFPSVGTVWPSNVYPNTATTFYVNATDNVGVTSCDFYVNGGYVGAMSVNSPSYGTASYVYTAPSSGSFTAFAKCRDLVGNTTTGAAQTVLVQVSSGDTTPPSVGTVWTSNPGSGQTSYSVSATDNVGVTGCTLYVDGNAQGAMSLSSGTWMLNSGAISAGTHSAYAQCRDAAGTYANGSATNVTVYGYSNGDTIAPTVGTVWTSNAGNYQTSYFVNASDNIGVTACTLYVDGYAQGSMYQSGGSWTLNSSSIAAGTHTAYAQCRDAAGYSTTGASQSVTVYAFNTSNDTTPPTVNLVNAVTPAVNVPVTITTTYGDNASYVNACTLYVDGTNVGAMNLGSSALTGSAWRSYTFGTVGNHTVYATCTDASGNLGTGPTRTVYVTSTQSDGQQPVVSNFSPNYATANQPTTFTASYAENVGITGCYFYVNQYYVGQAVTTGLQSGVASYTHTFPSSGTYSVFFRCEDASGQAGSNFAQTVTVGGSTVIGSVTPGTLVKTACPVNAAVTHPCKAVYYYGSDAKRHAFPNEKVYYSWYTNFNTVVTISDTTLASLPLGKNVNYRPGTKMVKFQTVPKVYAVTRYGVLRWVTSESVAQSLYGYNWAAQVDDIPESFYTNYTFGADITAIGQYVPSQEQAQVLTIDQNL